MPTNILLIQAPSPVPRGYKYIPFSISYIAAVLKKHGHKVLIHDMDVFDLPVDSISDSIDLSSFDVVGISSHTVSYPNALILAELVRKINPNALIVLGGPHVTFTVEETLSSAYAVDVVVIGEGEYTLLELASKTHNRQSWSNIKGIAYREGSRLRITEPREQKQLDLVPFPERRLLPLSEYPAPAIIASRGCPHNCIFCSARMLSKFRTRSVENVLQEINEMLELEPSLKKNTPIAFLDNTFASLPDLALDLCEELKKMNLTWTVQTRIDTVSEELLFAMRQAGCIYIHFGIESGSTKILKATHKDTSIEKLCHKIKFACDTGIEVACSFSIGHPEDTEETIEETISLIKELKSYGAIIATSIVTPFPGTELWSEKERFGINIETTEWQKYNLFTPVMSTRHLTSKQINLLFAKLLAETSGYVEMGGRK